MSHVSKVAALTSQGSHQEACQVGQSPHQSSLRWILSVKDTVVDDVILKQIDSLIDVSLIGLHQNWCSVMLPPVVFVSKISGGQSPCSWGEGDSGGHSRRHHCLGWESQVPGSRSCACPSSEVARLEEQLQRETMVYLSIDGIMKDVVQSISSYVCEGGLQSDHSKINNLEMFSWLSSPLHLKLELSAWRVHTLVGPAISLESKYLKTLIRYLWTNKMYFLFLFAFLNFLSYAPDPSHLLGTAESKNIHIVKCEMSCWIQFEISRFNECTT